jgi:phosphopantetheinyl transferase
MDNNQQEKPGGDPATDRFAAGAPEPTAQDANSAIIPDPLGMTRICPQLPPETGRAFLASLESLAAQCAPLAPAGCCLSLADLRLLRGALADDDGLHFLTSLLSPAEAALWAGFAYPKRRLEWLGGRLAAKHSLHRLLGREPALLYRDCSLLPDEHGRPALEPLAGVHANLQVSISHSRDYAAALTTAAGRCGLDIQQKTARLITVQERFASAEELALLTALPNPLSRLCLLWTAKEAVKKCCLSDQSTFFGSIRLAALAPGPTDKAWTARMLVQGRAPDGIKVSVGEFEEYCIACVAEERHA